LLSKVQSPALTSQGFSAVHLFKTFRTSEISRKNSRIRVKCKVHCNASSLCLTSALSVEARFFCRLLEKTKLVLSSKSLIDLNLPPFPQILWSVLAPPKASVYQLINGNPILCIYRALVSQVGYRSFKSWVKHLEVYKQYNVRNIQILKWIIKYNTFGISQAGKADKK
jgi:hypothetical protein